MNKGLRNKIDEAFFASVIVKFNSLVQDSKKMSEHIKICESVNDKHIKMWMNISESEMMEVNITASPFGVFIKAQDTVFKIPKNEGRTVLVGNLRTANGEYIGYSAPALFARSVCKYI